jgi:hypothetical protein
LKVDREQNGILHSVRLLGPPYCPVFQLRKEKHSPNARIIILMGLFYGLRK